MTALRRDPHLWLHLAGLASVPIWLDLCLAGLAVGDPVVPPWLEMGLLGLIGSVPLLWMQWRRPFYPFSLLLVAVRPDSLSSQRLQLLSRQRSWLGKVLAIVSVGILTGALVLLYPLAPMAAGCTPFAGQSRAVGWLIAAIAFFLANFFLQLAMSALPLLLTPDQALKNTASYDTAHILRDFTVSGIRLRQILPELQADADALSESPTVPVTTDALSDISAVTPIQAATENPSESPDLLETNELPEEAAIDHPLSSHLQGIRNFPTVSLEEERAQAAEVIAEHSEAALPSHPSNQKLDTPSQRQESDIPLLTAPPKPTSDTTTDGSLAEPDLHATNSDSLESLVLEDHKALHTNTASADIKIEPFIPTTRSTSDT
ncbi:MAG: low-complexity tail membrane protein [Cyanobacteria bacterium J06638_28]